jgi:hypothetical protein
MVSNVMPLAVLFSVKCWRELVLHFHLLQDGAQLFVVKLVNAMAVCAIKN